MLLLSENITIIKVTLTLIYLLTLGALLLTKSRLSNLSCLNKEIVKSIERKVKRLGMSLKYSELRLKLSCYSGILLGYSLLSTSYILLIVNPDPLIAIIFLVIASLILLNTRYLHKTKISCIREIEYLGPSIVRVKVKAKPNLTIRIKICDSLTEGVAIVKGLNCSEYTTVEGEGMLEYEYLALNGWSKVEESNVVIGLIMPLALHERVVTLKPKNIIKKLSEREAKEIKELRSYLNIVETLIEPSVSHIKPYTHGDDIKLIVSKSLLKPGGLSVKVLDKHREVRGSGRLMKVYVVLDKYFCKYAAGYAQLKNIFKLLFREGVSKAIIGSKLINIDNVVNIIPKLCSSEDYKSNLNTLYNVISDIDVVIASPESIKDVVKLVKKSEVRPLIVSIKAVRDNSIVMRDLESTFKVRIDGFQEWLALLKDNVNEVLSDRASLAQVIILENIYY